MIDQLLEVLPQVVTALTLVTAVFLTSLWLGMVLWTFRDIRSRSRDIIVQILATLMVGILTLPGLLVYYLTRPHETLAEAYEHALELEALLQAIEEPEVWPGWNQSQCRISLLPILSYAIKESMSRLRQDS